MEFLFAVTLRLIVSASPAYILFRLITVRGPAKEPHDFGRKFAAVMIALVTILPQTITTAIFSDEPGHIINGLANWVAALIGFGTPAYFAGQVYGRVRKKPDSSYQTSFGLEVGKMNKDLRNKLMRDNGALVTKVYDGSPAFYSNIILNDVLVLVDGVNVLDEHHAAEMLGVGKTPKSIHVIRKSSVIPISVEFGEPNR